MICGGKWHQNQRSPKKPKSKKKKKIFSYMRKKHSLENQIDMFSLMN